MGKNTIPQPYLSLGHRIALRFARGFLAGALSSAGLITFADAGSWAELSNAIPNLFFAVISGGVSGGLLALDMWVREKQVTQ